MGNVGDKILPDSFQPAKAGEILSQQEVTASMRVGHNYEVQELLRQWQFHRFCLQFAGPAGFLPSLHQSVVSEHFRHASTHGIRRLKEKTGGRIGMADLSFDIGNQHSVGHLIEHRSKAVTLRTNGGKLISMVAHKLADCPRHRQ
jgi:hypothetical protein